VRRATITIAEDLRPSLEAYLRQQDVPLALTAVVQSALREYLAHRGFAPPAKPLRITPASKGSGKSDISLRHDEYFARR
jgi:hypothetical protein